MLKKLILAAAAFIALASPALAQNPQTVKLCVPTSTTACPVVTASAPLPVTGTFSATLAGFTPNGSYTTLTATAASSASTNLPSGTVVAFQNLSTVDVSCVLTAGASTATTNKLIVRGGATVYYTVGSNTTTACINQTGSASNVVGLAGGSGLGTAFGGGGGGGGTVVQGNAGSNAQAWWTQIGDTARGPAKVQAGNAAAVADVALTVTDPNVLAAVNSPIPAGTNLIGDVNLRQGGTALSTTNGAYFNQLQGNAVLSASNPTFTRLTDATNAQVLDPCQVVAKTTFSNSQTANATIITGTSAKKTYLCSLVIIANAAETLSIITGTGAACVTTQTAALFGSTTNANGAAIAANGGLTLGNGSTTILGGLGDTADNVCLMQVGSSRLVISGTYVQL